MEIIQYTHESQERWNSFIQESENGNFLFNRSFMEYHSDRFQDASTILLNNSQNIIAVFPANIKNQTIYSHQGLTYGGLILKERNHIQEIIRNFYHIINHYQNKGVQEIIYKPVPNYFAQNPCDTEHFIMNMLNAEVLKVDTSFVTHLQEDIKLQERRRRSIKKAEKQNIKIEIGNQFEIFWNKILAPNLWDRYQTKPVHSLEEINLLHQRFPQNIKQANAYLDNEIVAGVTLFEFNNTAHCQYISSIDAGRISGAIDLLFYELIKHYKPLKKFFSMGTSNNSGKDLNLGVSEYKESFDTKIYAHFHYQFKTENIQYLEKFI